ncbi:hypothetical protein SPONL_941 [uncultured Candidatus Thioglobus sp.]|nr:hypothetical protein SPONL_941 [uncultured Candidatus Thioglobus sp.]
MSDLELITLLETEFKKQQQHPTKPFQYNEECNIEDICVIYLMVEKLIRVIANTVKDQSSHQAINQLRYAGHHILKHYTQKQDNNLQEAYKHCVRAHYDMLDYYVLKLSSIFQEKITLISDKETRASLLEQAEKSIKRIQQSRFDSSDRERYYQTIQNFIFEDMRLIVAVNKALADFGYTEEILKDKKILIESNLELQEIIDNKLKKESKKEDRFNKIVITVVALTTMSGLLFQGSLTDYWRDPITKIEHSLNLEKSPTYPIGKK